MQDLPTSIQQMLSRERAVRRTAVVNAPMSVTGVPTISRELLRNCDDGCIESIQKFSVLSWPADGLVMEKTTLGQALIERRIELGVDKASAAKSIGVTRATYAAYESDLRRLSVDVLPALRAFLDVAVEDFLDLYGATCVAQARVIILRDLFVNDASMTERPSPTTMLVKNVRDNELSVVERVFFDVVTSKGHGVASPYVTQPSAPTALRAPSSSVLGRFDDDATFSLNSGSVSHESEAKGKSKKRVSKSEKKNRKKSKKEKKEKNGKKKHKGKRKHKGKGKAKRK